MIPFIDLKTQYKSIESEINLAIKEVLNGGQYIMGQAVKQLEEELSRYVGSKYCIALSSGTDAQLLALMALGVGPGDEVIIPDFSFFATSEVVELLGANSVFIDIDPTSYNLEPSLLESKITNKTKAIMPVSLYGRCANLTAINEVANNHNLPVIEDGAQSFGATLNGKRSGSLSTIGTTSFFPSKPLGCYGDAGACFTDDENLAIAIRELRTHGQAKRYTHTRIGTNARIDTIQAAILLEKLKIFDKEIDLRNQVAQNYLSNLLFPEQLKLPQLTENTHVFAQFTLEVDNRDALREHLLKNNIPTAIHYPIPLSKQPIIEKKYGITSDTPVSLKASERVISLPMSPYLKKGDQDHIIEITNNYMKANL